jgi:hypothetical protein
MHRLGLRERTRPRRQAPEVLYALRYSGNALLRPEATSTVA